MKILADAKVLILRPFWEGGVLVARHGDQLFLSLSGTKLRIERKRDWARERSMSAGRGFSARIM